MAAESGATGLVKISSTAVAYITGWTFDTSVVEDEFSSNETVGYMARVVGAKKATGTLSGKLNTAAAMTILVATAASLLLYVNATEFYTVPAFITGFRVTCVVEGKATSFEATYGSNGAWTEPTWA